MTMITPSYLGETIEYSSLHACRSTLEDPTHHGAALVAMTVVEPSPYANIVRGVARGRADEQELADASRDLAALGGLEGEVASGVAGQELALFSARVDLLVVGSRGYGPLRSLMFGSTAVYLANDARCPLLVLPRLAEPPARQQASEGDDHTGAAAPA